MKADLIAAASEVITNQQILVNMVSRRVRQLSLGHRPLVEYAPGLREADIALTEIAAGKLTLNRPSVRMEPPRLRPGSYCSPVSRPAKKLKKLPEEALKALVIGDPAYADQRSCIATARQVSDW